jgi:thiosulfate reductase cytochrome b subunit
MATHMTIAMIVFVAFSVLFIAGLLVTMHLRHRYQPNLIGALIGALLCFILLETLPAIM